METYKQKVGLIPTINVIAFNIKNVNMVLMNFIFETLEKSQVYRTSKLCNK